MTSSDVWTSEQAQRYDSEGGMFSPEVVGPAVRALTELANGGAALEFAIGTGRIGVPLRAKGVPVTGIELSEPMVDQLRTKVPDLRLRAAPHRSGGRELRARSGPARIKDEARCPDGREVSDARSGFVPSAGPVIDRGPPLRPVMPGSLPSTFRTTTSVSTPSTW